MSKGTYSHSNRHRMHEPQVTNYDEVANLKGIIKELKRILSTCMYALQENDHLQQTIEALRHDNRELKRMLDKAFDAGFELEDDE